jgi:hypothetical protein
MSDAISSVNQAPTTANLIFPGPNPRRVDRRRPFVIVVGMHRSGTSLCSHVLSALGVDMADEIGAAPSNPKGHWERQEIVEFHNRILGLFDRSCDSPLHDLPLPPAWWVDPRVARFRREMAIHLEERMTGGLLGFKDPRAARLLPVWCDIFSQLNVAPKIVICLRNPAQVARSLLSRDGQAPQLGEYRWLVYLASAFRFIGDLDFCLIEYEDWFEDRARNIDRLCRFLSMEAHQSPIELDMVLSNIVDAGLCHDDGKHEFPISPLVQSFYRLLKSQAAGDPEALEKIGSFVSDFALFEQLQLPLQEALVAERAALLGSRSWRVTAPLRWLNARLAPIVRF